MPPYKAILSLPTTNATSSSHLFVAIIKFSKDIKQIKLANLRLECNGAACHVQAISVGA